jgi:ribosomal-protein-alanine N-acetyltransferase
LLPERALSIPVALRPFEPGDAARVAALAGEQAVAEMTALIPHPYPDGAAEAWIAAQPKDRAAGRRYTYAITPAGDAMVVGAISLCPAATEREQLGYWIGRAYWGRGYATAAASAMIALAFTLLDLDRLSASRLSRNRASGRVLEKCGLRLLRTEERPHRGANEAFCVHGLTRSEWIADNEAPAKAPQSAVAPGHSGEVG